LKDDAGKQSSPFMGEDGREAPGEGSLEARARAMRLNPTEAERKLWQSLKAHRFAGYKFRLQEPIGNYIVDFVCFKPRIVVEVDGSQHDASDYDKRRDRWLASQGFRVLRFWNIDVLRNLDGVLDTIAGAIRTHPTASSARRSQSGRLGQSYWSDPSK
jgi:very-short-patch-repair endonuclease